MVIPLWLWRIIHLDKKKRTALIDKTFTDMKPRIEWLLHNPEMVLVYNWRYASFLCPGCRTIVNADDIMHKCPEWPEFIRDRFMSHFSEGIKPQE